MAFRCPYCQFRITSKTPPKPGRYTPTCPKCQGKFILNVSGGPGEDWTVEKISGQSPIIPHDPEKTEGGPSSPPSPPVPKPVPKVESAGAVIERNGPRVELGEATEVTGVFAPRPQLDNEQTALYTSEPAIVDQTAAMGRAAKTRTGDTGGTLADAEPAATPRKDRAKHKAPRTEVEIPNALGGYEIVEELGRGGMGAVFLARQVSLDRPVALKVMNSRWSNDPVFLARFTREAFAAAQLVHHNVVQIYDIGEQDGVNYFSMEFVDGKSLADVVRRDGPVDVSVAIGYALQAARGLKYAHDRGMIHRDVKPDNLMLNLHGIVKVADLGLVKTPTMTPEDDVFTGRTGTDPNVSVRSKSGLRSLPSDITMAETAMGSPAFMSPEQCKNAATVDPRADVYSLGCSLYALLAGHPPFDGENVFEVMSKHAAEPPVPIPDVPKDVNFVLLKMLAKRPEDRHQSMDELIVELNRLLPGKDSAAGPMEQQLSTLEDCVRRFHSAPMARVRKLLIPALVLGSLVAAVVGLLAGSGLVAAAIAGLIIETTLAYFVIDGLLRKTYVFRRVREWAFGARKSDWAIGIVGVCFFAFVLWLLGLLWVALGTALVAVGVAFAIHLIVDTRLDRQRQVAIDDCRKMMKRLRLGGMDEDTLRMFVAKNSDRHWEEFFEMLFGFEAKLAVRPAVEEQSGSRLPHFAAWREPLVARIDRAQAARREAWARKLLQKVEAKKLQAEGIERRQAEEQAAAVAEHMVEQAAEIKAAKKPVDVKVMLKVADKPPKRLPKPPGHQFKKLVNSVFGWKVRFIAGALLVLVGAMWVRKQIDPERLQKAVSDVHNAETSTGAQAAAKKAAGSLNTIMSRENPLAVPMLGNLLNWVDCVNPLVAGLILVLSAFSRSGLGVLFQLFGAAVALLGHQLGFVPTIGPVQPHVLTLVAGVVLAALGVFASRK